MHESVNILSSTLPMHKNDRTKNKGEFRAQNFIWLIRGMANIKISVNEYDEYAAAWQ